ncbi:hypothetical protein BFW01_g8639 [Lasiodiplodia theobromae]|nr:hypothetical protein BFW01_g8639 [Lasiodiplodia theobromae]
MTSHTHFNERTPATEVAETFSSEIKNRYFVVTGISKDSIGETTAKALASKSPALLILASRTLSNIEAVASEIRATYPNVKVEVIPLDLLSQESVRQAADQIKAVAPQVDVIINNAAMTPSKRITSPEGIEGQFAANHLGGFLLTNLLAEKFPAGAKARIVNVTSEGHRASPIRWSDLNLEKADSELPESERGPDLTDHFPAELLQVVDGYSGFRAYGQTKTANILTAVALNKKFAGKAAAYSAEPGVILTNGSRDFGGKDTTRKAAEMHAVYLKDLDQGASTTLVAALDPALQKYGGNPYFSNCQFGHAAEWATNEEYAEKLWELSEDLVGQKFF